MTHGHFIFTNCAGNVDFKCASAERAEDGASGFGFCACANAGTAITAAATATFEVVPNRVRLFFIRMFLNRSAFDSNHNFHVDRRRLRANIAPRHFFAPQLHAYFFASALLLATPEALRS